MKITDFLRLIIVATATIFLFGYGIVETEFIDGITLILFLIYACLLYYALGRYSNRNPLTIIVALVLIMFVLIRITTIIFLPESLLYYQYIESKHLNFSLFYIILCSASCILALKTVGWHKINDDIISNKSNLSEPLAFNLLIISLLLTLLVYFFYGYAGSTGSADSQDIFQRYISRFIYPYGWLIIYLVCQKINKNKINLIICYSSYALFLTIMGSRSGLYEIIFLMISCHILFNGNEKILISKKYYLISIIFIFIMFLSYVIGTELRQNWYGNSLSMTELLENIFSYRFYQDNLKQNIINLSYRISFLEPTIFTIFTDELNLKNIDELVNIKTTFISSLNRLIPGKPFGDILYHEYAYGFMYEANGVRAYSDDGRVDFVGYEWSIFGISYKLFGFIGGLIFTYFITKLLTIIIYHWRKKQSILSLSIALYMMSILVILIKNFGIDNLIDRTIHGLFFLIINFSIFKLMSKFVIKYN